MGKNKSKLKVVEYYDTEVEEANGKYGEHNSNEKKQFTIKKKPAVRCPCGNELTEASWSVVRCTYFCTGCGRDISPEVTTKIKD